MLPERQIHSSREQLLCLLRFSAEAVYYPRLRVAKFPCGSQQQLLGFYKMYDEGFLCSLGQLGVQQEYPVLFFFGGRGFYKVEPAFAYCCYICACGYPGNLFKLLFPIG